jgi:hypothetical protein
MNSLVGKLKYLLSFFGQSKSVVEGTVILQTYGP